jgi:cytochrome oxidase Cu insertion factor (SCO1/SenC/PrrC family)
MSGITRRELLAKVGLASLAAAVAPSGSIDVIDRVTGGFGASFSFVGNPGNAAGSFIVIHSTVVYLVNQKGEWELIYDFQQLQEPAKVAADIHNILHR